MTAELELDAMRLADSTDAMRLADSTDAMRLADSTDAMRRGWRTGRTDAMRPADWTDATGGLDASGESMNLTYNCCAGLAGRESWEPLYGRWAATLR